MPAKPTDLSLISNIGEAITFITIIASQQAPGKLLLSFHDSVTKKPIDRIFIDNRSPKLAAQVRKALRRYAWKSVFVFYSVNAFEANSARVTDLAPCTIAQVDADGVQLPVPGPQPSAIVETSPGNRQFLYFLNRKVAPDEVQAISAHLTKLVGGDAGGHSPAKLLRCPGTRNFKAEYGPNYPTTRVVSVSGQIYDVTTLLPPTRTIRHQLPVRFDSGRSGVDIAAEASPIDVESVILRLRDRLSQEARYRLRQTRVHEQLRIYQGKTCIKTIEREDCSEVIWRFGLDLKEAGATPAETFAIIQRSAHWRDRILRRKAEDADRLMARLYSGTVTSLSRGFIFDGEVPIEPPRALVKGIVPLDGILFVGGQSGAGKTFIVVDLAVCLATGTPFLDRKVAERVGVAILAAEGSSTIAGRIQAARQNRMIQHHVPVAWLDSVPNLADPVARKQMIELLRLADKRMRLDFNVRLGAIVCDTLAAAFALEDENSNSEAVRIINAMREIGDAIGAVVIPVHHYGKSSETGLRGASAWHANADSVLSVLCSRAQLTGKVSGRSLALAKSRVGEEGPLCDFSLRDVELGHDAEGVPFESCVIELATKPDEGSKTSRAATAYMAAVRAALRDNENDAGLPAGTVDREAVRKAFKRTASSFGRTGRQASDAIRQRFNRGEQDAVDLGHIIIGDCEGRKVISVT